jgi:hypothetical protein
VTSTRTAARRRGLKAPAPQALAPSREERARAAAEAGARSAAAERYAREAAEAEAEDALGAEGGHHGRKAPRLLPYVLAWARWLKRLWRR